MTHSLSDSLKARDASASKNAESKAQRPFVNTTAELINWGIPILS